jgi:Domain of unknown function (DUF4328)
MDRPTAPWGLARVAQLAVVAVTLVDWWRVATLRAHHLLPDARTARQMASAVADSTLLLLVAIVVFLVWLGRCRRNAEVLSPGVAAVPGAWAVIAWLVPIVNWWVPRRFLLDVQRASGGTTEGLVNAWAVFWVLRSTTGFGQMLPGAVTNVPYLVVEEGVDLAAAALAVCVIQRLTALQGRTLDSARLAAAGA